jgi:hypothetical protein
VYLNNGATFTLNSGTISGFIGQGVRVTNYSGTTKFIMNGGQISGNYNSGVDIGKIWGETSSGTAEFIMTDGIICDNRAEYEYSIEGQAGGGVVGHNGAHMTMSGGEITRNNAYWGGGVGMLSSGLYTGPVNTFTMTGGTIYGNMATYGTGGGVYTQLTNFAKIGGGTIYGSDGTSNANIASGSVSSGGLHGHAVHCYTTTDGSKVRENTAGTGINLSYNLSSNWQY